MKKYEFPMLDITVIDANDVITTSVAPEYVDQTIDNTPGLESPILGESNFK